MAITDIIGIIPAIREAMKAGKEIKDPASWKQGQLTTNRIFSFLAVLLIGLRLMGYDLHVTDETLITMSGGVAAILAGVNNILTTITSTKVGK